MTKAHPAGVSHMLDVYDVELHLCWQRKQLDRLRKDLGDSVTDPNGASGVTWSIDEYPDGVGRLRRPHVVVWVDWQMVKHDPTTLVNVLAHEAAHVAGFVAADGAIDPDPRSEHMAYLIGWVAGWLWSNLPPLP